MTDRSAVALLFVLAAGWHALWAASMGGPADWDQAYYLAVARHIAAGDGAVTGAVWNLLFVPEVPGPADGYWMPLPSRVLVPGLWLWPAHGEKLVGVALAALWAPAGFWMGRALGLSTERAALAGVVAALAGPFSGRLPSPDTYALYGLIGSLGLWGLSRDDGRWMAVSAGLAALCRADGVLWGLALATGLRDARGVAVAFTAALTTLGWSLRNFVMFGLPWVEARAATARVVDYPDLIRGEVPPLGMGARLWFTAGKVPEMLEFWLLSGMGLLTALAFVGLWRHRDTRWVQVVALFWVALPLVETLLAPAVAWHGTLYRSVAAVFPALAALGVAGLFWLNDQAVSQRGYPRAFLPGAIGFGLLVVAIGGGAVAHQTTTTERTADCAPISDLDDDVLFTYSPTLVEAHCGRASIVLVQGADPAKLARIAKMYRIRHAFFAPDTLEDEASARAEHAEALLPGWERVSDRVYRRP